MGKIGFLLVLTISFWGCKKATDSSTKSLDNFNAQGLEVKNACRATPVQIKNFETALLQDKTADLGNRIIGPTEADAKFLRETLAVLPPDMLKDFLAWSSIKMVSNAAEICAGASASNKKFVVPSDTTSKPGTAIKAGPKDFSESSKNGSEQIAGCWVVDENDEFQVVIGQSKAEVGHAAVRTVLYFVTQVLMYSDANDKQQLIQQAPIKEFQDQIQILSEKFVEDALKKDADLRKFNKYFSKSNFFVKKESLKSAIAKLKEATAFRNEFDSALLANVLDSHYCSDTTRKNFKKFPKTRTYFNQTVGTLVSQIYGESSTASLWFGRARGRMANFRSNRSNMFARRSNGWSSRGRPVLSRIAARRSNINSNVASRHQYVAQRRYQRHSLIWGSPNQGQSSQQMVRSGQPSQQVAWEGQSSRRVVSGGQTYRGSVSSG